MCSDQLKQYDGDPCEICGSTRHSTAGHAPLETSLRRWGIGLTRSQLSLPDGTSGAPSRGMSDSVPPDLVRIVPSIIFANGTMDYYRTAAILRLWKEDPEGACTCMLSWASRDEAWRYLRGVVSGAHGFDVSVGLESSRLWRTAEPLDI